MSFRLPSSIRINWSRWAILWLLLFSGAFARGQQVILHLRNGDRIAGFVISENTNQVVLSNSWINGLAVPLSQIAQREILSPGTNLVAAIASTNTVTTAATANPLMVTAGTNAITVLVGTNAITVTPSTNAFTVTSGTNKVAVGLLVSTAGTLPPIDTNTFWRRWKGEASIGTDFERGAAENELYYGKATFTYTQPYGTDPKLLFKNILTYDAAYGKTTTTMPGSNGGTITMTTLSDNRMGGSSKTDFDISPRYYVYNLGAAYYDEIRKINLGYEEGPGVGYHLVKLTNLTVNLELGATYQVQHRSDDTSTYSAYYRMGEDLMWKISKQVTFTQKFEYFPRVGYATQYRMRFESTLTYALLSHLSWNASIVDFYDTQPAAGVPNNDLQLRTSLGVKF